MRRGYREAFPSVSAEARPHAFGQATGTGRDDVSGNALPVTGTPPAVRSQHYRRMRAVPP